MAEMIAVTAAETGADYWLAAARRTRRVEPVATGAWDQIPIKLAIGLRRPPGMKHVLVWLSVVGAEVGCCLVLRARN